MTAVEIGQEAGTRQRITLCIDNGGGRDVDTEESRVRTHKAPEHAVQETGIRYQKCGGGRRIIRRSRSGN